MDADFDANLYAVDGGMGVVQYLFLDFVQAS